jgi:hypothetical protein
MPCTLTILAVPLVALSSGTFVAADQLGEIEVRVATSGLLIRPSTQDSGNSSRPVRSGDQNGTPELS